MKFRGQLLVVLLAVALVTSGLAMLLMYRLSRHLLFEAVRSNALSVAATTAALIDGDAHRGIRSRADEGGGEYVALREQLRRARDANRRADTYVKYLITVKPSPQDPNLIEFGVDPEENPQDLSHVGDVLRISRGRRIRLEVPEVDSEYSEDQWGKWLSANAPVKDRSGQVVAAVDADVSWDRVERQLKPLWTSALISLGVAGVIAVGAAAFLSTRCSRPIRALTQAVERIGGGDLTTQIDVRTRDEFGALGRAVNAMAAGLRERETVKSAFARYVSRQVMDSVLGAGQLPVLQGDRRKITVLFCDIRAFTPMTEHMRPEQVVQVLNDFFEKMVDIVFRNEGTLDKFIGDGMMVIFGAPKDDQYQEEHAIKAALEMRDELARSAAQALREGRAAISAGIGINSGTAVVGNIGSSQRMEYTAIGDTVNLASRLQAATRELNVDILISEYTHNAVRGAFKFSKVGPVRLKGRTDPVVTYTVESV